MLPPAANEVEVTLIGPGRGECVVVHIGGGSWIVVDSCVHGNSEPAAIRYLAELGVRAAAVRMLVATHWHDDHVRGFAGTVDHYRDADVVISSALEHDEFLTLVATDPERALTGTSGVRELYRTLTTLSDQGRVPTLAVADRRLLFLSGPDRPVAEVWALSPSDASLLLALQEAQRLLPIVGAPRGAVARPLRNPSSVAMLVLIGETGVLLGADLERSADPRRGWGAVISSRARPQRAAHLVKIPHHGSPDAHEDGMWTELLVPGPHAGVTPFIQGRSRLPALADQRRIAGRTPHAWLTRASEDQRSPRRPRAVERMANSVARSMTAISVEPGRVTFRCSAENPHQWFVEASPSAIRLTA